VIGSTNVESAVAFFAEEGLDMAGAADAVLVVASQDYVGEPSGGGAPGWVLDAFARAGWSAEGASTATIAVEFVDGHDRSAAGQDLPQIEAVPAVRGLPVAATVRIPVNVLTFSRGGTSCAVEVADISTPLAREWASQVTQRAAMRSVGAMLAAVDEKGAALIAGDLLMRADLWEEGVAGGTSRNAPRSRALASEVVDALSAAHGG
jgi:hypothetical protein